MPLHLLPLRVGDREVQCLPAKIVAPLQPHYGVATNLARFCAMPVACSSSCMVDPGQFRSRQTLSRAAIESRQCALIWRIRKSNNNSSSKQLRKASLRPMQMDSTRPDRLLLPPHTLLKPRDERPRDRTATTEPTHQSPALVPPLCTRMACPSSWSTTLTRPAL